MNRSIPDDSANQPRTSGQRSNDAVGQTAPGSLHSPHAVALQIRGMHCAGCVGRVETALRGVPGVTDARVSLATASATVMCHSDADINAMIDATRNAGFEASPAKSGFRDQLRDAQRTHQAELQGWRRRFWVGLLLLSALFVSHYASPLLYRLGFARGCVVLQVGLATTQFVYVGAPFLLGAARLLRRARANMDTLIAIGTLAAYAYGCYTVWVGAPAMMPFMDAAMILVFVTLGKYLEQRARGRMSSAVFDLMTLMPDVVFLQQGDTVTKVAVSEVHVGDTMLVRPGDRCALDGVILAGTTRVDESWLTGEPQKIRKSVGDTILSGSINGEGSLQVKITTRVDDSSLGRVIQLVRQAQESKAPVQRLADRWAAWFVPIVLLITALTFIVWARATSWQTAIPFAVAVTVVSCPCALGLATPTAIIAAVHAAARRGILIRNAAALETAHRLSAVVFDKTGTMTHGGPQVQSWLPTTDQSAPLPAWFQIAAAVEQQSSHPLAVAINEFAMNRRTTESWPIPPVDQIVNRPGEGVTAVHGHHQVLVGNDLLLRCHGVEVAREFAHPGADLFPENGTPGSLQPGHQLAYVAIDGHHVGSIFMSTALDPHAPKVISDLRQMGLTTAMLTGDCRSSATHIGQLVGIDQVQSQVSPVGKYDAIRTLQQAGHVVAMVGDGINDAAGLAAADLGIAMGTGAAVAVESADVILVQSDLRPVVFVVHLARRTFATIRNNLIWAFAYNLLLIPIAAGVLVPWWGVTLPPSWAAAAMAASSLTVVFNSLRLMRFHHQALPPYGGPSH